MKTFLAYIMFSFLDMSCNWTSNLSLMAKICLFMSLQGYPRADEVSRPAYPGTEWPQVAMLFEPLWLFCIGFISYIQPSRHNKKHLLSF